MWEYTVAHLMYEYCHEMNLKKELNDFGKVGWELIHIHYGNTNVSGKYSVICTFKRHIQI